MINSKFKIQNLKFCFVCLGLFVLSFLFTNTAFASLRNDNCSLGLWNNDGQPVDDFRLNLSDPEKGVQQLSIMHSQANIFYPVNAPLMYSGSGLPIKFDFAGRDRDNQNYYISINGLFSDMEGGNSDYGKTYGNKYEVIYSDTNKTRLLPGSYIKVVEKDSFLTGGDDPITLTLQTTGNESTMVWADDGNGNYGLKAPPDGNWDDLDWDTQAVFQMIDIEIRLSVPLKFKGNPENTIEKQVNALIKVEPSGITFKHGLESETLETSNYPDLSTLIGEANTRGQEVIERKAIGQNAPGLRTPDRTAYDGISGEKSLDEFLVGIANFSLSFAGGTAVLFLIYGGYLWLIDRGEGQMAEKARKIIAGAVIGLLIIISSYSIIRTVVVFGTDYDKCELATRLGHTSEIEMFCTEEDNEFSIGIGLGGVVDWLIGGLFG